MLGYSQTLSIYIHPFKTNIFKPLNNNKTYLGDLDLLHEPNTKIFVDNTVRGSKKGQDVRNKVLLVVVEALPVLEVATKIYFFGCR